MRRKGRIYGRNSIKGGREKGKTDRREVTEEGKGGKWGNEGEIM